jgi:hypothetical protein
VHKGREKKEKEGKEIAGRKREDGEASRKSRYLYNIVVVCC